MSAAPVRTAVSRCAPRAASHSHRGERAGVARGQRIVNTSIVTEFDLQSTGLTPALAVVELGPSPAERGAGQQARAPATLVVGLDRAGRQPELDASRFDLLLTMSTPARRPWIGIEEGHVEAELEALASTLRRHGPAAAVLAQLLRAGASLGLDDALALESFAFSMLLAGPQFAGWLRTRPAPKGTSPPAAGPRVRCTREGDALTIHLANPARRNAFDAAMRDALVEALATALDDPTSVSVTLRADGPDFSAGGDLYEFGSAVDPVQSHFVRTLRSPARLLGHLSARATVHLHGACVGAGIEVPAAAGRLLAAPDTRFWLPELQMGLIPGAGGTATLARRIGRHRLLYWALRGLRLDATTALSWGLIDSIEGADTPPRTASQSAVSPS